MNTQFNHCACVRTCRRRFKEILGPLLEQIRQDSLQIEDLVIKKIFSENEAAHVIQRAWRRYSVGIYTIGMN